MFLVAAAGYSAVAGGLNSFLSLLKFESYDTFSNNSFSIIPMFLLMGYFATLGGMSTALFKAAEAWLGHRKGGVAMAAVGSCAGFGAICGSSLATAATMSRVALPEMRRYGYDGGFATATLAAGGTLGILIPPSIVLVIYAILTEQNIEKLFIAAIIPGLLAALGYMIVVSIYVRVFPERAGLREPVPYSERFKALFDVWPVLLVFGLVVGGIYAGWFSPTEGAAIGALGTGLIAYVNGGLTRATLAESFYATARSTAMIFFIVLGAFMYNSFLGLTQLPQTMAEMIASADISPWLVLILILCFYLVMGCVMDSLSMILLTVPILWPLVQELDFNFVSMAELHAAKFEVAMVHAQATWDGLVAGGIPDMGKEKFAETLAAANQHMATLGLGSVGDAVNLNPSQIAAVVYETTQQSVDEIKAIVAQGGELSREMLRELEIRGASKGVLNRINTEQVAIWFGVLVLIVVEVGLITPPVGMNLFIINAMDRTTPMGETYKAVLFFVASDLVRVAILVAFPIITLALIPLF